MDEAAAYGVAYLTAYVALVRGARVEPGEWVLVHGAAGGVGLATVDLAKALGARVIAAASSPAKRDAIAASYAVDALIGAAPGFREEVKMLTGGRGADVIFDPVGGDVFDESTRCIAFGGRLLVVGFASGRIPEVSVNMPLIKGFSVVGVRAGEYGRRFPGRGRRMSPRSMRWRRRAGSGRTSMRCSTSPNGAKALRCSSGARWSARSCCGPELHFRPSNRVELQDSHAGRKRRIEYPVCTHRLQEKFVR